MVVGTGEFEFLFRRSGLKIVILLREREGLRFVGFFNSTNRTVERRTDLIEFKSA